MKRAGIPRILVMTVAGVATAGILAVPFSALAQDANRGGMLFKLSIAERFVSRFADSPAADEDGRTTKLTTDIDLGFRSETRAETFTLDIGSDLRAVDGPTTDGVEMSLTAPTVDLRYAQTTATADVSVGLRYAQTDLADVSAVDTATDANLTSDSVTFLDGGTRSQLGFDARLEIRKDAPFGLIFALSADDIRFDNLPEGSETKDRTTARFSTTGRFDINPVLQARLGFGYDAVDRHGGALSERYGLSGQAVLARPNGDINVRATVSDGDGGVQSGLSFGRSLKLPQTEAAFTVGATLAESNDLIATGRASFKHEFGDDNPFGAVSLTADRKLALNDLDAEEVTTGLSLAGSYAINPLAELKLSAGFGQAESIETGEAVTLSEVGLSLGYQFDPHWRGSAGWRAEQRAGDTATDSSSTTISIGVSRSFERRR